jgi:hypothetical protein
MVNEITYYFTFKFIFMKKFFFLALVFCAVSSTTIYAQTGGGPTPTLQEVKDRIKPQMVAQTKLTRHR